MSFRLASVARATRRIATQAGNSNATRRSALRGAALASGAGVAGLWLASGVVLAEAPEQDDGKGKKPIYDDKSAKLPPSAPPSDLELFIRKTRHTVTEYWNGTKKGVGSIVDTWISFEEGLAKAIQDVRDDREPTMPGAAILGASFVAGMLAARQRGFIARTFTPLTFTAISMVVVYPRTTRNILAKSGGQPILDGLNTASSGLSDAYEATVNTIFDGYSSARKSLSSIVGKTEDVVAEGAKEVSKVAKDVSSQVSKAVSNAPETLSDAVKKAEGAVEDAMHRAEDAVKHALDHPKTKPPPEFEGGAELNVRSKNSYVSLEVSAADTPTGKPSPPSAVTDAIHKAEEAVEHALEDLKDAVKKAMDHPQTKPPKEFEGGAELNVRGPESFVSLEVDSADTPSGTSPHSVVGDAVHRIEEAVESAVESVKHALDHPKTKPPAEFEGGAELHLRGPESYGSLEVMAADKPTGKPSPHSVVGDAVHRAEEVVEEIVHSIEDKVKHALDHPKTKPPAEFEGGAELRVRGPESYASLEVAAADTPTGKASPHSVIGDAVHKIEEVVEEAVHKIEEKLRPSKKD